MHHRQNHTERHGTTDHSGSYVADGSTKRRATRCGTASAAVPQADGRVPAGVSGDLRGAVPPVPPARPAVARKGTHGVSTNWVTDLFPNLSKFITFAAAPLVSTPFVRNQLARGLRSASRGAGLTPLRALARKGAASRALRGLAEVARHASKRAMTALAPPAIVPMSGTLAARTTSGSSRDSARARAESF